MKQGGGGVPTGRLFELIEQSFGSYATFRAEFENAGNTAFGSGWAWLVYSISENTLKVMKTTNAETPLTDENLKPILTMVPSPHCSIREEFC
jgi:Fe-Mn family superoxide dismutase